MQSCLCHQAALQRLPEQGEGCVSDRSTSALARQNSMQEAFVPLPPPCWAKFFPKSQYPANKARQSPGNHQSRQLQSALKTLRKALTKAQADNERAAQACILTRIGLAHCHLEEYAWGIKCLKQGLQIAQAIENRATAGVIFYYLGVAYRQTEQEYKALRVYLRALSFFQDIGDRASIAEIFNQLGEIYKSLGQLDQAQRCSHQALLIFQDLGNVPEGEGAALHNLGDVYLQMGRLRQALALLEQALVIYRKIQDRYSEVMALESIGTVHACLNQETQSLKFYQQALEIQQSMDESPSGDNCASRIGKARTLDYMGAVYYKLGNYPLALGYHLRALGILHALDQSLGSMVFLYDSAGSEKFLQNMKTIYTRLRLHSQGAKCYQQALEIIETFGYQASEQAIENYFYPEGGCTTKK